MLRPPFPLPSRKSILTSSDWPGGVSSMMVSVVDPLKFGFGTAVSFLSPKEGIEDNRSKLNTKVHFISFILLEVGTDWLNKFVWYVPETAHLLSQGFSALTSR